MPRNPLPKDQKTALSLVCYFFLALLPIGIAGIINIALKPSTDVLLFILVAPVIEELTKAATLRFVIKRHGSRETAHIGMVLGLGFGVFETLASYPQFILRRLFTSIPMHVLATGIDGYAVGSRSYWILGASIGLHSIFNTVANSGLEPLIGYGLEVMIALGGLLVLILLLKRV